MSARVTLENRARFSTIHYSPSWILRASVAHPPEQPTLMKLAFATTTDHHTHQAEGHPERPARLDAVHDLLRTYGHWDELAHFEGAPASDEDLLLVHDEAYLRKINQAARREVRLDTDTYATRRSESVARHSLGQLLAVTRAVVDEDAGAGFAAIRPPGHHATPSQAMGFCLYSNVAVAARWTQKHRNVKRIAIVDFDVHHGNGTQNVFYEDGDVLFVSLHQHPHYPGTGRAEERGRGDGAGATVNVPLPAGTGDNGYLEALDRIVEPVVRRFEPMVLFVSAGYDAHVRDPLGGMQVTTTGFATMMRRLHTLARDLCGGRLVATLEGGYDTDALAHSVLASLKVLADPAANVDDPFEAPSQPEVDITLLLTGLMHDFDLQ